MSNIPKQNGKTGTISNSVLGNPEIMPPSQYYTLTLKIKMETKFG